MQNCEKEGQKAGTEGNTLKSHVFSIEVLYVQLRFGWIQYTSLAGSKSHAHVPGSSIVATDFIDIQSTIQRGH